MLGQCLDRKVSRWPLRSLFLDADAAVTARETLPRIEPTECFIERGDWARMQNLKRARLPNEPVSSRRHIRPLPNPVPVH